MATLHRAISGGRRHRLAARRCHRGRPSRGRALFRLDGRASRGVRAAAAVRQAGPVARLAGHTRHRTPNAQSPNARSSAVICPTPIRLIRCRGDGSGHVRTRRPAIRGRTTTSPRSRPACRVVARLHLTVRRGATGRSSHQDYGLFVARGRRDCTTARTVPTSRKIDSCRHQSLALLSKIRSNDGRGATQCRAQIRSVRCSNCMRSCMTFWTVSMPSIPPPPWMTRCWMWPNNTNVPIVG